MLNGRKEKVFCGERVKISGSAVVADSIIWDNVTIEDDARVSRAIIGDDVKIKAGERFENAAIVRADMLEHCENIPEKALKGKIVGENYVVPLIQ